MDASAAFAILLVFFALGLIVGVPLGVVSERAEQRRRPRRTETPSDRMDEITSETLRALRRLEEAYASKTTRDHWR